MAKIRNLKFSNELVSLILAGTLSMTLVGCVSNDTKTDDSGSEIPKEQPNEGVRGALDNVAESAGSAVNDEYEKVKGDNAVEAAITVMIDGAEKVGNATEEYKQTEEYQEAKEQVISNFDTIHDVSDTTKEKAKSALNTLDGYIEKNIPDYKEKAKEKLKKAGDWIWDKSTDAGAYIKDKGSEWLDEVRSKQR